MKKITIILLAAFCLMMVGCSKDAEINAFIAENHTVIEDIVKKIDANPSEAGVDEAQKSFDGKKAGLKTKWDAVKDARGVQVSSETTKKLTESMTSDMKMLTDVQQKQGTKLAQDGEAMNKFVKLVQEYAGMFKQ
jgi:hypothetical protein